MKESLHRTLIKIIVEACTTVGSSDTLCFDTSYSVCLQKIKLQNSFLNIKSQIQNH